MDLKEALATNLRRERHAKEMTQEELADQGGEFAVSRFD
jgi:transcriptional regulator with XRE-family HTH domain